jgi:membrane associated rhomboid family serine protease
MLYLWIFGSNIEDFFGPVKFIGFYIISGIFATAIYTVTDMNSEIPLIGASGAIAGLLGAYLVLYPQARVQTLLMLGFFIQFVRVPAKILLGFWIAIQIISGLLGLFAGPSGGGTAWFAHIGGFAFGYFYFKLTRKKPRIWGLWS